MAEDVVNLGAVRAQRSSNAADWSPRDAIEDCLRRIDAGELKPDACVVVWREKLERGETRTNYAVSGPDVHTVLGLLSACAMKLWKSGRED